MPLFRCRENLLRLRGARDAHGSSHNQEISAMLTGAQRLVLLDTWRRSIRQVVAATAMSENTAPIFERN
jgi:hypothetical protein